MIFVFADEKSAQPSKLLVRNTKTKTKSFLNEHFQSGRPPLKFEIQFKSFVGMQHTAKSSRCIFFGHYNIKCSGESENVPNMKMSYYTVILTALQSANILIPISVWKAS